MHHEVRYGKQTFFLFIPNSHKIILHFYSALYLIVDHGIQLNWIAYISSWDNSCPINEFFIPFWKTICLCSHPHSFLRNIFPIPGTQSSPSLYEKRHNLKVRKGLRESAADPHANARLVPLSEWMKCGGWQWRHQLFNQYPSLQWAWGPFAPNKVTLMWNDRGLSQKPSHRFNHCPLHVHTRWATLHCSYPH